MSSSNSGSLTGCFPLLLLPGPCSLYVPSFPLAPRGGGGGNRSEVDSGAESASTFPAYMRRNRAAAWLKGSVGRINCFSESVVVVRGDRIDTERSGREAVKRIIRYTSWSGRSVAAAMVMTVGAEVVAEVGAAMR